MGGPAPAALRVFRAGAGRRQEPPFSPREKVAGALRARCAGIDVAKATLTFAIPARLVGARECANAAHERRAMTALLKAEGVRRVGMEATGVYRLETAGSFAPAGFGLMASRSSPAAKRGRDGKR